MNQPGNPSTERAPGREHIPLLPKWFLVIRGINVFLAVIVLGMIAYCVHLLATSGNCLMLFVSLATLIVMTWLILSLTAFPRLYNYWAALAMDAWLIVVWLSSFSLLAQNAAVYFSGIRVYSPFLGRYVTHKPEGLSFVFATLTATASGIGAVQFVLFVTSLVITAMAVNRHRKAGLHCRPGNYGSNTRPGYEKNGSSSYGQNTMYHPVGAPQPGAQGYMQQDTSYNNGMTPSPGPMGHQMQNMPPQQMYPQQQMGPQGQPMMYGQMSPQQYPQQYQQQQHQQQQPQQMYDPNRGTSPAQQQQGVYSPPPQQGIQQPQPMYPSQTHTPQPLAPQHTGGSSHTQPQPGSVPPMPNNGQGFQSPPPQQQGQPQFQHYQQQPYQGPPQQFYPQQQQPPPQ